MTTTTAKGPIATDTPILALDLDKYKSVACGRAAGKGSGRVPPVSPDAAPVLLIGVRPSL
jgi:hypothetical protein